MFDSFVNKTGWKLILSQNDGKFVDVVVKANPGIIDFEFKNECRQGLSKIGNGHQKLPFILCVCAVKPWYETTCCGICLVSDANLPCTRGQVQA